MSMMMHSTLALELIAVSLSMMMVMKMSDGLGKMLGYLIALISLGLFVCSAYYGFMEWRQHGSAGMMSGDMMQGNMMKNNTMMNNGQMNTAPKN